MSLELATTDQLIEELFKRETFAGVIVYSPDTHRFNDQHHDKLIVRSSCEPVSIAHLLECGLVTVRKAIQ